jgi:hypothetical protein
MATQKAGWSDELPLHVLVRIKLQQRGVLDVIDAASALLSVLTVVTYITDTYDVFDFRRMDFVVALIFIAEWLFRWWLSTSRFWYLFSWRTLVDIGTILPMIVLPNLNLSSSATATFRLLRLFRIFR